ncbi:MAG: hypothetical protein JXA54_12165 [Candidatus Heimdallarchaeota archaeon]|nr:hypothetical protein [Candidatus Heimdallarchaeota archaeon]
MTKTSLSKIQKWREYRAEGRECLNLLRKYPLFFESDEKLPIAIDFYYSSPTEENLRKLRETYELDIIAGQGSEVTKIINLMTWVYQLAAHANEPAIPTERNAFSFIHMAKNENKSINCYMKTVILNEVYLSMGFFSRYTHLLPYTKEEETSHYITSVYSQTLGKWISMDPDFGVYVKDRKGIILGVAEIRKYMIERKPMKAIHIGKSTLKQKTEDWISKLDYFWFLSLFIFKIRCPKISKFNQDSEENRVYYELLPKNYNDKLISTSQLKGGKEIVFISDESAFWKNPEIK